jgi:mannose-1-phosphate guanylyltransferase
MLEPAWAVVLAGGDGTRLRSLTHWIAGDDRPKQFCRLYGGRTLLAHTRSRLARAIAPERTLFAVVAAHQRFYKDDLADVAPSRMVVQPANLGTTAAIVYSLARARKLAGDPVVGIFPTDHYYAKETPFIGSIHLALQAVRELADTVILLGAGAAHPEVEYGWIEPGAPLKCRATHALLGVNRFWEKPSLRVAQTLFAHGCLWNTFVMIGRASAFLNILRAAVPRVLDALGAEPSRSSAGCAGFDHSAASGGPAAEALAPSDFSGRVLSTATENLAVLPLGDVGWSDLGTPERVQDMLERVGPHSGQQSQNGTPGRGSEGDGVPKVSAPR